MADVLNKKIATLESQEGSAYGAALLAMVGTGAYGSVEECCGVAIREVDHVLPDTAECQSLCEAAQNLPGDLSGAEAHLRPSVVFADVALPVPLDQPFTYLLPETLRHRVKIGCRLIVPFGSRKLTGVIVHLHATSPSAGVREALRLLDEAACARRAPDRARPMDRKLLLRADR